MFKLFSLMVSLALAGSLAATSQNSVQVGSTSVDTQAALEAQTDVSADAHTDNGATVEIGGSSDINADGFIGITH